jgi:hypothetical protein
MTFVLQVRGWILWSTFMGFPSSTRLPLATVRPSIPARAHAEYLLIELQAGVHVDFHKDYVGAAENVEHNHCPHLSRLRDHHLGLFSLHCFQRHMLMKMLSLPWEVLCT